MSLSPVRILALTLVAGLAAGPGLAAPGGSGYHVLSRLTGPDGGWDYASYDPSHARILVARATSVDLYDPASGSVTEAFAPAERGHAAVTVNGGHEILITNGTSATATFVDAETGAPVASVPTGEAPDAVVLDDRSGLALVMDHRGGDIVLIDLGTHTDVGRIAVGGVLEAAAVDGQGHAFVNVEDQNLIAVIDIASHAVTGRYGLAGCEGPTGLAYAAGEDLLIAACDGVAEIVTASTGKVVRSIPMGEGADGVAYDAVRKLAFVPAGESGTMAVLRIAGGDAALIDTVETARGARTLALDPQTGRVFLPSATYAPALEGQRPVMIPGTFRLLVVGPPALE